MLALRRNTVAMAILAANPGFPPGSADNWAYVGYKGGSEPGVLNLTWLLINAADESYILTMSWNNPEAGVSTEEFMGYAQQIIADHVQSGETPAP